MAAMTEREQFEAALSKPPHAARMIEHAGRYVERLERNDKDMLLADAIERMWALHGQIKKGKDVLLAWISALNYAAERRPRWRCWYNVCCWEWVKGTQLGRRE
jgi:hypothetical protein